MRNKMKKHESQKRCNCRERERERERESTLYSKWNSPTRPTSYIYNAEVENPNARLESVCFAKKEPCSKKESFINLAKSEKGITLLALVVTIIIIIILVAIAINLAFGENGLIKMAESARTYTEQEGAREKIALEVMASYGDDGEFDIQKLKDNLKNNLGIDSSNLGDNLPSGTINLNGYDFYINEEKDVVYGRSPITVNDYGEYIDLGTNLLPKGQALADGTIPLTDWRIFYEEDEYICAILADNLPNSTGIAEKAGLEVDSGNFAEYGVWVPGGYQLDRDALVRALTSDWTEYIFANSTMDKEIKEKITAKGSPTLQEWIKSWNSLYTNLYAKESELGWQVGESMEKTGSMYTFDKEEAGYKNSLYFPRNNTSGGLTGYWLATESDRDPYLLMDIHYGGFIQYFGVAPGTYYSSNACLGIRPIVFIPSELLQYNVAENTWKLSNNK